VVTTASQIRAARALIGAKQSDLARAAGISLATLNNVERGVGDPRTSTLNAIERALETAGVEFAEDPISEAVRLRRLERPAAFDTFTASQRILELLGPKSLTRVAKVLFFARRARNANGETAPRVCLLVEAESRAVLFDQVEFTLANRGRVAEVAGILLWALSALKGRLYYLDQVLDDTTTVEVSEVVARLRAMPWQLLVHPAAFFDVFDDWQALGQRFAGREGHPMRILAAAFSGSPPPP
jgi:transcriptional regulator with XRE-family HTH domain